MKVAVVGGGVVGTTTAYFLAELGMDVVLLEKQARIAPETSRSNAGLIAPGHSSAWASPGAPRMLVRSLLGREASIGVRFPFEPRLVPWGVRFLRNCTSERARRNTLTKLRLAAYSQVVLEELIARRGIECHYGTGGVLYLYRSDRELAEGIAKMSLAREHGREMRQLTPEAIVELEPALRSAPETYAGGLHGVRDTTADSQSFTEALLQRCADLRVEIRLSTEVTEVLVEDGAAVGVRTSSGEVAADQVVLCAGAYSPMIRARGRRRAPVYPAKGYALTVPVLDPSRSPRLGGIDERTLVAWSPLGGSLRMSATAEFAGFDPGVEPEAVRHMVTTGQELFGDALDWDRAHTTVGYRPMTPDGPPVIGQSRVQNLYYNTGHGHMGWTMACGSAVVLRDLMTGRTPEIDLPGAGVRSRRW